MRVVANLFLFVELNSGIGVASRVPESMKDSFFFKHDVKVSDIFRDSLPANNRCDKVLDFLLPFDFLL